MNESTKKEIERTSKFTFVESVKGLIRGITELPNEKIKINKEIILFHLNRILKRLIHLENCCTSLTKEQQKELLEFIQYSINFDYLEWINEDGTLKKEIWNEENILPRKMINGVWHTSAGNPRFTFLKRDRFIDRYLNILDRNDINIEINNKKIKKEDIEELYYQLLVKKEGIKKGIYFLYKDNKIVYIGQSINIERRIKSHLKDKEFDKYEYLECREELLNDLEAHYIIKYQPELNKCLPKNDLYEKIDAKEVYKIGDNYYRKK